MSKDFRSAMKILNNGLPIHFQGFLLEYEKPHHISIRAAKASISKDGQVHLSGGVSAIYDSRTYVGNTGVLYSSKNSLDIVINGITHSFPAQTDKAQNYMHAKSMND